MNSTPHLFLVLLAASLVGCADQPAGPPKTIDENTSDLRSGKVPDNVRDPRPEMPPVGPLGMPMR